MQRQSLRFTPFHLAGALLLAAGLVVAVYHGLEQFDLVPRLAWTSWSHIHFVTIGGFTQLLFGTLPQLAARKLRQPVPGRWYTWPSFAGLNGGLLLAWYGRGWGAPWAFDAGLVIVWLLAAALLVVLVRMALRSDRAWDAIVGLYLVSTFVFLWGLTYAYGLYAHVWRVPGGWLGLREAHVHANAWGFLGLAVVGTLYDLLPRVLDTELYSETLKNYSAWLLVAGIFPLVTGPWLGMGRTVTATGLVLYAAGFALYLYDLLRTYLAADARPGVATSLLAAQFWLLAPAAFAPVVLFGVDWVAPAFVEDGALHFLFVGWALPVALAGLQLYARAVPGGAADSGGSVAPTDLLPGRVPEALSTPVVAAWNVAVLAVGVGFFYQDQSWSALLFGPGYAVLAGLWLYQLVLALRLRWSVWARTGERADADA